jgi:UDP-3-O-[3-hydroxymyristoyl] N-acetylglucosamine deacetylase
MASRRTLQSPTQLSGVGVRSGQEIGVRLEPAESGAGLRLARTDLGDTWPLSLAAAYAAPGCSGVGTPERGVIYVEHLMAALGALGITEALVQVDGPEIPLLDGSAQPWGELLREAGVRELLGEVQPLVVTQPHVVHQGEAFLAAIPAETTEFIYVLEHPHPLIGRQWVRFRPGVEDFWTELAPARTFTTEEEARQAQAAGWLPGGSEANALVIYPDHYSADPTVPQACARHKLLDLLGDLYLLGRPVQGRILAYQSGHRLNHELARSLADLT